MIGNLRIAKRWKEGIKFRRISFNFTSNTASYLQSWTRVLGTVLQYSYFPVISRFPLKTTHPFRNFLAVLSLSPRPYTKLKLGKNSGYTCPTFLWGEGRGLTLVNLRTPQKCKSVPRLLSMIVASKVQLNTDVLDTTIS